MNFIKQFIPGSLNTKEFLNGLYTNLKIINIGPSQNMENIQFESIFLKKSLNNIALNLKDKFNSF
jgi:hypothetical protein